MGSILGSLGLGLGGGESSSATATSGVGPVSVTPTTVFGAQYASSPTTLGTLATDAGSSPVVAILLAAGLVLGFFAWRKYA